jgi:putative heme-binding domain-containing protein
VLQAATLAALGRMADERAALALTTGWNSFTPTLKSQALDLLLSRNAWQRHLLASIEKGEVPAALVDVKHRERLLESRDQGVRTRAAKLFGGGTNPDRRRVLEAFRAAASLPGDSTRGKGIFTKTCAVCHQLQGVGHVVGPDLTALANKTPEYLLIEILDPNRNVDARYVEYLAVTRDGRTFTGILASESATGITLRAQEGKEQTLLRSELEELRSTGRSLMPEGLEKDLSRQDLADLIAYVGSSGSAP